MKKYADVTMILDRSGSMSGLEQQTIDGFNKFISTQKEKNPNSRITLVLFSSDYEEVYVSKHIDDVAPLTSQVYYTTGMTALNDAIGKSINTVSKKITELAEQEKPGKVIFVIVTDGHENSSSEFSSSKIRDMIAEKTGHEQWEFVYLGANQDAIVAGAEIGIDATRSANYSTTNTDQVFAYASNAVADTTKGVRTMALSDDERRNLV